MSMTLSIQCSQSKEMVLTLNSRPKIITWIKQTVWVGRCGRQKFNNPIGRTMAQTVILQYKSPSQMTWTTWMSWKIWVAINRCHHKQVETQANGNTTQNCSRKRTQDNRSKIMKRLKQRRILYQKNHTKRYSRKNWRSSVLSWNLLKLTS